MFKDLPIDKYCGILADVCEGNMGGISKILISQKNKSKVSTLKWFKDPKGIVRKQITDVLSTIYKVIKFNKLQKHDLDTLSLDILNLDHNDLQESMKDMIYGFNGVLRSDFKIANKIIDTDNSSEEEMKQLACNIIDL